VVCRKNGDDVRTILFKIVHVHTPKTKFNLSDKGSNRLIGQNSGSLKKYPLRAITLPNGVQFC
jgi:hypothetical protein